MMRAWCFAVVAAALVSVSACDGDGATQGHRGGCATPTGVFVGCDREEVIDAEDACWRLVECAVIPLERNSDQEFVFDWRDCVFSLERLPGERESFAVACIAASSCDDLRLPNSPTDPNEDGLLCLAYGDLRQDPNR